MSLPAKIYLKIILHMWGHFHLGMFDRNGRSHRYVTFNFRAEYSITWKTNTKRTEGNYKKRKKQTNII